MINIRKINVIDFLVVLILIIITTTLMFSLKKAQIVDKKNIFVTIKVTSDLEPYLKSNLSDWGVAYLNSVNEPVKIVSIDKNQDTGTINGVKITVSGPGEIKKEGIIFNGTRILIGQKAEIHSNYFAQGIITEIKNESN